MGWLIAGVILAVLLAIPLGGSIRYDCDGIVIRVIIGPIRFRLNLSGKDKKVQKEKKPKKKEGAQHSGAARSQTDSAAEPKKKGGSLLDFLPLLKTGCELLNCFRRKLRVNFLQIHVIMASPDPYELAVNYGRTCAAMGNLMPMLDRSLVIKRRDIDIGCDFTAAQTLITAQINLTITLGRILGIAIVYGVRALVQFLKIMKNRKGGVSK